MTGFVLIWELPPTYLARRHRLRGIGPFSSQVCKHSRGDGTDNAPCAIAQDTF